jgi:hypothetical protein
MIMATKLTSVLGQVVPSHILPDPIQHYLVVRNSSLFSAGFCGEEKNWGREVNRGFDRERSGVEYRPV